ncbi:uncharacterized protein LOC132704735 [Cylas formicarius]|uniref:uncharacterized protein LOC132704735 n=1 Tax=Cylas formicarius TaxID=197179 RepID=UPI0029583D3B|nr:uncharacterized protein LOC132704735 [Cylas formicarius]XP_060530923.1 uncharacterized protein LOC132704735 [Cylas formicarius]XP_060530925.1 uncharacterized protein LOC132704735 [Cylas formicarius]
MRVSTTRVLLCLYVFVQAVSGYQTTKNVNQRTTNFYGSSKMRHSSRFPNLDKVRSRLDTLNADQSYPRFRHHGWMLRTTTTTTTTQSPLFDVYGDLEGNEDDGEEFGLYDDKFEDDDPTHETAEGDDDDDDAFFDRVADVVDSTGFQSEQPTEKSHIDSRPVSSLTEYKWIHYGTLESVRESRRKQLSLPKSGEENHVSAVVEHYIRVKNDGLCQKPIPKVIPVQQEHPNASITYIPHCTVLHRCAEDTGCCKHDTTCQYKAREEIRLYFYTKAIGSSDRTRVEQLTFYNHTSCECRSTRRPKDQQDFEKASPAFKSYGSLVHEPENLEIKCKCPDEFTPKMRPYAKCSCDCDPTNQDCLRMQKGKEYIGLKDRLCILKNQCGTVQCEYGSYIRERGRCPRKDEFLRSKMK